MHIFWFFLMVSSFMVILFNNFRVVFNYDHEYRNMTFTKWFSLAFTHFLAYAVFYFGLTRFFEHLANTYIN